MKIQIENIAIKINELALAIGIHRANKASKDSIREKIRRHGRHSPRAPRNDLALSQN